MKKYSFCLTVFLLSSLLWASDISFSGGFTQVSLQDNNHVVTLFDGAIVNTEDVTLSADTVKLYGEDYKFVECTGKISVEEKKNNILLDCADLLYDRETDRLVSNGWVEINDMAHEARLTGSWLEFNTTSSEMKLQIRAKIEKNTDSGFLSCTADSILYNANNQTLTLKGNAKVKWGEDSYNASLINVNIDTEDITLHGSITGEVHGN